MGEIKIKKIDGVKCFVLDMDGTIYLGDRLFDETKPFLSAIKKSGRDFIFFTNNSSKSVSAYIKKLENMGISVDNKHIFNSIQVVIDYIKNSFPDVKSVFPAGTAIFQKEFELAGFNIHAELPDLVVLGFDIELTYEKISRVCTLVRNGVPIIGANPDFNCPIDGGFIPDCGAIAALVHASTGVMPEFFGKPSRHCLDFICKMTGYAKNELAFVGDRLYTDMAITNGTDALSMLVLTGEATLEDVEKLDIKPDFIFNSINDIKEKLEK